MDIHSNHPQIDALIHGDPVIMKLLYQKVFPKAVSFIIRNKGTYEDGEEIFQSALFQLIARAKVKGIQIKSTFEGYVLTVCKNLWLKELNSRKKVVRNEGVFELKDTGDVTIQNIMNQERWDLFEEKLDTLSQKCAELLKAYFNKVSYNDIVEKFNYATENAAFQRVFKCKKKLMDSVKADFRYRNLINL